MSALLVALGLALVLASTFDVIATVLAASRGAGPITGRLALVVWRTVRRVTPERAIHRVLRRTGTALMVLTLAFWLVVAWAGWTLVFHATPSAVRTAGGSAASGSSRAYYAGTALIGRLGTEYEPGGAPWQLASLAASVNGLFLAGLSIAYLLPVVSAVAEKRQLAGYISTLGESADEIVLSSWDGDGFGELDLHLVALTPQLGLLAQRHLAYPQLHYFHSSQRFRAAAPSIAALDEALSIVRFGVVADARPDSVALRAAQAAVHELLQTLNDNFLYEHPEPPLAPSLEVLAESGLPVVSQGEFEASLARLRERRALLRALVEHDGWNWSDVCAPTPELDSSVDERARPTEPNPVPAR